LEDADFQNGTIHDKTGVALTLKVNRLTGDIPHALENAYSIDILTGNVFQCVDYSKLPHEDPAYRYYVCGSDELNQSMIAFVSLLVGLAVCFLFFAAIYYRVRLPEERVWTNLSSLLSRIRATAGYVVEYTNTIGVQVDSLKPPVHALRPHSDKYPNYLHFLSSLNLLRRIFLRICAVVLLCCLPVYLLYYLLNTETSEYSTHTDRYAWITTTAFLSGQTPAVTLFCMWMTLCSVLVGYVLLLYNVTYKSSITTALRSKLLSMSSGRSSTERESECTVASSDLAHPLAPEFPATVTDDTAPEEVSGLSSLLPRQSSVQRRSDSTAVTQRELRVRYSETVTEFPAAPLPYEPPTTSHTRDKMSASSPARSSSAASSSTLPLYAQSAESSAAAQSVMYAGDERPATEDASLLDDKPVPQGRKSSTTTPTNAGRSPSVSARSTRSDSLFKSLKDSSITFSQRLSEMFTVVVKKVNFLSILPMSVCFLMNAVAAITANVVYVCVMYSDIPSVAMFLVQISMAAFKLFWNLFVVRKLISHIPYNKDSIRMHALMLIFNTLVAPCIASAFTDSACFKDLIFGSNTMTTSYAYESCLEAYQLYTDGEFTTICTHYAQTEYVTEYNPPFVYNYSCGSSILTSYIPVYIYSYTMLALILPLVFLALASTPTRYIPKFLLRQVDAILRPQDRTDTLTTPISALANGRPSGMAAVFVHFQHVFKARSVQALAVQHLTILLTFGMASPMLAIVVCAAIVVDTYTIQTLMIRYVEYQTKGSVFYDTFNTEGSGSNSSGSVRDSEHSVVSSLHSGHSDPASATASRADAENPSTVGGTIGTDTEAANERSSLLSLRDDSVASSSQNTLLEQIHEEERMCELDAICAGTWRCLRHTIWMVYYFCIVFYSALLFDVVGDSRGLMAAISVPISALIVAVFSRVMMATILTELRTLFLSREDAAYERLKAECGGEGSTPRTSESSSSRSGIDTSSGEGGLYRAASVAPSVVENDLTVPLV
jgi:ABC-type proline/glycine betaine transport system permease subunit